MKMLKTGRVFWGPQPGGANNNIYIYIDTITFNNNTNSNTNIYSYIYIYIFMDMTVYTNCMPYIVYNTIYRYM